MAEPYYADEDVTLHLGDCLDVLAGMAAGSVDAVVTDPPYGLEFMGREWDTFKPSAARIRRRVDGRTNPAEGKSVTVTPEAYVAGLPFQRWCEAWAAECLRVLKPGGHLLAFGGTRTWHRLVCGIEDAGFEVRDAVADLTGYDAAGLMWVYGSGFPKSLDVSKAIDKRPGVASHAEFAAHLAERREAAGLSRADVSERVVGTRTGACWNWEHHQFPEARWWPVLRDLLSLEERWGAIIAEAEREVTGQGYRVRRESTVQIAGPSAGAYDLTAPATDDAARWEGWGTALKPGWEPIAVGRKPLAGTVAGNVLEWGTGALNIDGCRVAAQPGDYDHPGNDNRQQTGMYNHFEREGRQAPPHDAGRWPPNVVLGPAAAAELDRQSGVLTSSLRGKNYDTPATNQVYSDLIRSRANPGNTYGETGGASRFFPVFRYEAKAGASERPRADDGTAHPTVKPLDLMRWLVRLVTPPGGLVLDLFAGSGTTGEACVVEGFRCVLAEKDPASAELIKTRLRKPIQPVLFGDEAS